MLTIIAGALVDSLAKYLFTKALNNMDKVDIGGAPSWYMQPVDDKLCVFTHSKGGYDSVEVAKDKAKFKMIKKIDGIIEVVVYDNMKHVKSQKERELIKNWSRDDQLSTFVRKNLEYSKISYEDEVDTTFVRACIDNQTILSYQDDRLKNIQKSLMKYKMNSALDELDQELGGM